MAKVYASIRGAQGVAPGVIVPFSKECQSDANLLERVPGGYLRCDGKVYAATSYPALAKIIGVGPSGGSGVPACAFSPGQNNQNLVNPTFDADGNFTAGTFAVPNLGAKVLIPASASGQEFMGNNQSGGVYERAGIGYVATIASAVNTTISGTITGASKTDNVSGSPSFNVENNGTSTTNTIDIEDTAGHTHSDAWKQSDIRSSSFDGDVDDSSIAINDCTKTAVAITHTGANITHNHTISGGGVTSSLEYERSEAVINYAGSSATANISADARKSLDHLTTPYLILEYIIKI
jgi:hypothetical protein